MILPDRVLYYYAGSRAKHGKDGKNGGPRYGMDIGLATLRRDGWYSLDATAQPGTLLTKPFVHPGGDLMLNVDAQGGSVVAEFVDADGQPLKEPRVSQPVVENAIVSKPAFAAAPADLAGQTVRLKLSLTNASLYAFWFQ